MVTVNSRVVPGSRPNEDLVRCSDTSLIVLDGATGLTTRSFSDAASDGRWYVERLAAELATRIGTDRPLSSIVAAAVGAVSTAYDGLVAGEEIAAHERPSTAGAICRWSEDALEYFVLGDCTVTIRTVNGTRVIRGEGPRKLDERVVEEMAAIRDREPSIEYEQLLERVRPMLVEHRAVKNEPGGYWTLGLDPSAVDHAKHGAVDRSEIDRALAFTDGFEPIRTTYDAFTNWESVLRYVDENGLDRAIRILRAFETADPQCERYPRLKPSDDVGVARLEL